MKVLEPVWAAKPETASRLRGPIEAILAWATVRGRPYRRGDLFDKRRRLMDAWGEFCMRGNAIADVLPLRVAGL